MRACGVHRMEIHFLQESMSYFDEFRNHIMFYCHLMDYVSFLFVEAVLVLYFRETEVWNEPLFLFPLSV